MFARSINISGISGKPEPRSPASRQFIELFFGQLAVIGDNRELGLDLVEQIHRQPNSFPLDRIAFHFHDTRATALANTTAALRAGIRTVDSSAGGTGGCPYAPGAAGNLATEDLVYLLDMEGYEHGIQLAGVLEAARFISGVLGRPLASKVGQAGGWDAQTGAPTGR